MKENKGIKILALSLAVSGAISVISGIVLNNMKFSSPIKKIDVKVIEKKIAKIKSNVPILKNIEVDINKPISVDVKEYIENIDDISDSVLREFKLDTSLVNLNQAGKYDYIIEYDGKKYKGNVIVKDKEVPVQVVLQLKNLSVKLNEELSTDPTKYLDNTVSLDILKDIKLDITKVNTKIAGDYQYTITYNNLMYTGAITVFEEQPSVVINTINYKIRYRCGNQSEEVKKYETSSSKSIMLYSKSIVKPDSFKECSDEIDTSKTKYTFPIEISDDEIITIYYKQNIVPATSNEEVETKKDAKTETKTEEKPEVIDNSKNDNKSSDVVSSNNEKSKE